MSAVEKVRAIVTPVIEDMGYELVRVHLTGGDRPTLQIMAERADGAEMTVDDCAEISHAVSAILDVEDPIPSAYHLEVSSPGIDRPLTRRKDYERFAGFDAKLETAWLIEGQRRFRGRLMGLDGEDILLNTEAGQIKVPVEAVHRAKLLLTDELIEATRRPQG